MTWLLCWDGLEFAFHWFELAIPGCKAGWEIQVVSSCVAMMFRYCGGGEEIVVGRWQSPPQIRFLEHFSWTMKSSVKCHIISAYKHSVYFHWMNWFRYEDVWKVLIYRYQALTLHPCVNTHHLGTTVSSFICVAYLSLNFRACSAKWIYPIFCTRVSLSFWMTFGGLSLSLSLVT